MPAYPEETQKLIELANAARSDFSDAENEYNNVNNQIEYVNHSVTHPLWIF